MSTFTVEASSANESAERTRPNSSARGAGTRPGGDRPRRRALAHQPVDVAVEHVVERARAAAGEREPEQHRGELRPARPAARADEHPGRAGEEEERHDPRLRQRHVVAPRAERRRLAPERDRQRDERGGERGARRPPTWTATAQPASAQATRPPVAIASSSARRPRPRARRAAGRRRRRRRGRRRGAAARRARRPSGPRRARGRRSATTKPDGRGAADDGQPQERAGCAVGPRMSRAVRRLRRRRS